MSTKTRIINGFEVPAPVENAPELHGLFYTPALSGSRYYDHHLWFNEQEEINYMLKRGIIFLNSADAIANAKAMLGIDPYGEVE